MNWIQKPIVVATLVLSLAVGVLIFTKNIFSTSLSKDTIKDTVYLRSEQICDLVNSDCSFKYGKEKISLELSGKVKTMHSFKLTAKIFNFKHVEAVSVKFVMTSMKMGMNIFNLVSEKKSTQNSTQWLAPIILPVCTSNRSDWDMTLKIETTTAIYKVTIPLRIK